MVESVTLYIKADCLCCRGALAYATYEGLRVQMINVLDDLPRYREELVRLAGRGVVPVFVQAGQVRVGFKNLNAACGGS